MSKRKVRKGPPVKQIQGIARITNAEALVLMERYKSTGCLVSRNKVIEGYMLLLVKFANEAATESVPAEDLLQEASVAACRALDNIDLSKTAGDGAIKISSYISFYVRKYLDLYKQRYTRIVRVPQAMNEFARRARREGIPQELMSRAEKHAIAVLNAPPAFRIVP